MADKKDKVAENSDKKSDMSPKDGEVEKVEAPIKFRGKYISTIGRRKTAIARVRMYKKGEGIVQINEMKLKKYFSAEIVPVVLQPLKLTGHTKDFNFSIFTRGGGSKSQSEAIRHGISRALVEFDEGLKSGLKVKGWLGRDARRKERKKPGLKKARRAPQWSKR